jgi:transcriptional regulator with XRE-family HTH domain
MLTNLLDRKGITQKKLAWETGLSSSVVSKIISGIRKDISIVEVAKISKALKVPTSVFCDGIACDNTHPNISKQKTLFGARSVVEKVYENQHVGTLVFINYFFDKVIVEDSRRFLFNNSTERLQIFLRVEKGLMTINGTPYRDGNIAILDQNTDISTMQFHSGAVVQSTCLGKYEPFWEKFKKEYIIAYKES